MVGGRERIYLDCFYNELSPNPKAIETLSFTQNFMRTPTPCTTRSSSSARQANYASARSRRGEILQYRDGRRHPLRRHERNRFGRREFRPLADRGTAGKTIKVIRSFLEKK